MRIGIAGVGRIGALHAATLAGAGHELLLADLDAARAAQVAAGLTGPGGAPATARVVAGAAELFVAGVDALVVASATDTHAGLLRRALVEGVPVFCEKPVSPALGETIELAELERATGTFAQIGFQRRFDAGYRRARAAVESGELGAVHSVRAATLDNAPPPASYIAASGGIFADCCIHDFDVIRYLTGREVVAAYAAGGTVGPAYITELGDAPTVAGVLTLDDGSLASFAGTRCNVSGTTYAPRSTAPAATSRWGCSMRRRCGRRRRGSTTPAGRPCRASSTGSARRTAPSSWPSPPRRSPPHRRPPPHRHPPSRRRAASPTGSPPCGSPWRAKRLASRGASSRWPRFPT